MQVIHGNKKDILDQYLIVLQQFEHFAATHRQREMLLPYGRNFPHVRLI